ncbi:hypothetical protein LC593_29860 [Nostoc sp. CHAB 5844]|nr:hypothetical protein [Nostoc sp. CHAB 5844]
MPLSVLALQKIIQGMFQQLLPFIPTLRDRECEVFPAIEINVHQNSISSA